MKRIIRFVIFIIYCAHHVNGQSIVEVKPAPKYEAPRANNITGILGAFPEEVKLLLAELDDKKDSVIQRLTFTEGTLKGAKVVIAYTGIGKVNASLKNYDPDD